MRDDFGIDDIVPIKVGLTAKQVVGVEVATEDGGEEKVDKLQAVPRQHGSNVFELEAVPPVPFRAFSKRRLIRFSTSAPERRDRGGTRRRRVPGKK